MRFEVNETANGVVTPDKNICKVKGCNKLRFKRRKQSPVCKKHSGLRLQISKAKFSDLVGNNEIIIIEEGKRKDTRSKRNKMRSLREAILGPRYTLTEGEQPCLSSTKI